VHRGLADRHGRRAGRVGCTEIGLADAAQAGYVPPRRRATLRAGCRATAGRPHGGDGKREVERDGRGELTMGRSTTVARGCADKTGRLGAVCEGERGETTSREKNPGAGRVMSGRASAQRARHGRSRRRKTRLERASSVAHAAGSERPSSWPGRSLWWAERREALGH
jgi:hypothetical protein